MFRPISSAKRLLLAILLATALSACGDRIVEAPQFSPGTGTYTSVQAVTLSSSTSAATIFYTVDGSAPSCLRGVEYEAAISVASNMTLKAVACLTGEGESAATEATYVIALPSATPSFNPSPGTFTSIQSITLSSITAGATIHYTTSGADPACTTGTVYTTPVSVANTLTLKAVACATGMSSSPIASGNYAIELPAAAPSFDPLPGTFTSAQSVIVSSTTAGATIRYTTNGNDPSCVTGAQYSAPVGVPTSLTLKAVACAAGMSQSPLTSGGYAINLPPVPSVWSSIDIDNPSAVVPVFAAGSTSTNENGDAVNISGRGKFEGGNQVFRFVYTAIAGDFVFTARLDGVDFAGIGNTNGRIGLMLAPELTGLGNAFRYAGALLVADGSHRRSDRIAAAANSATSTVTVPGTGTRYLRLTRTGNQHVVAFSRDGGATYVSAAARTFTAGLPATVHVGFAVGSGSDTVSASATFSDVTIRDSMGNVLVGPGQFTGDIGSGIVGGGGSGGEDGISSPTDISQGAAPAIPPLLAGSVATYNLEGYAAATVTGGGNIADSDARYRKVTTATELVAALRAAQASDPNPVRVIEIMNDLNLGWHEIGIPLQGDGLLRRNILPKKHPALIASGVGLLDIQNFNGLTIFSRNGATIRHAELNIKNGTNLILRNLRFDELWEWDEATSGDYDSNDWDFVTIGDGEVGATSNVWVDHCTFTKAYDGVLDIKRNSANITISWTEVVPAAAGPGSFVQQQFDFLEANLATNQKYGFLRGYFSQQQLIDIALPQKKGHLIGANNLEALTNYTITLHHNYYKDLQDRMPRLRGGDVHAYNLYVDNSNARIVKAMRDGVVALNAPLQTALDGASPTYKLNVTLNGAISTEGGAVQVERSVFWGVLTPLRNNQTDPGNALYTGAIRAFDVQHILLASDTAYMPLVSQQTSFTDRGFVWATWRGDSSAADSTLGPVQAPQIAFAWRNGTPAYPTTMHTIAELPALLTGTQGAGAGKVGMTAAQWLQVTN